MVETGCYTRLMIGGCFSIVFLFLINAIFAVQVMQQLPCARCGWRTASISFWIPV